MNGAFREPMTVDQFLIWGEAAGAALRVRWLSTARHGGRNCRSPGDSPKPDLRALTGRLQDSPCQPYGSELKIRVAERIRYPEAFVVRTSVPPRAKVVTDPVVIFEVVSGSSVTTDFVTKNAEYRATLSVQRYVVLQQTKAAAAVFFRKGDDWVTDLLAGDDAVLRMPEIRIEIPLSEIYWRVEFEVETGEAEDLRNL